jgi:chaperonin GroES
MVLQPLGDRLIVEVLEEEELTASGIVLPDVAREKPQRGRVLAVGPGARGKDGKRIEMDVAQEDEVVFSKYGGTEIKLGAGGPDSERVRRAGESDAADGQEQAQAGPRRRHCLSCTARKE